MIEEEDLDVFLKLIVVGNGGIGKSSMIHRYCRGNYSEGYKKTIGVDFLEKQICCDGQDIKLQIWDTAGQEEFDSMTRSYYRGAHMCLLVFSSTDRDSFESLLEWKHKVYEECGDILMIMIQNKMDLVEEFEVDRYEVENVARMFNLKLFRTSVKNNSNIDQVFHYLLDEYLSNQRIHSEKRNLQNNFQSQISIVETNFQDAASKAESRLKTIKLDSSQKRSRMKKHLARKISRC